MRRSTLGINVITIVLTFPGAIFTHDQKDSSTELAFKYAVYKINKDKIILPKTTLEYDIQYVPKDDSFHASKKGEHAPRVRYVILFRAINVSRHPCVFRVLYSRRIVLSALPLSALEIPFRKKEQFEPKREKFRRCNETISHYTHIAP